MRRPLNWASSMTAITAASWSKMLVMAVISPVMVATVVAGVVLAAHRTRYDRFVDDLKRRPAEDPQPGGVGR